MFYRVVCFCFTLFFSKVLLANNFMVIKNNIDILTNEYQIGGCSRYEGEQDTPDEFNTCVMIYFEFSNLIEFELNHDKFGTMSNEMEKSLFLEELWFSNNPVLKNELLFRTALAAVIAKYEPSLRKYIIDKKLEKTAYNLLDSSDSPHYLKANGLRILGSMKNSKYIERIKNIAILQSDDLGSIAVMELAGIVRERDELKIHLEDIYEKTDSKEFRKWLDYYVNRRGGWKS
ncbi:hypothetical protein [Vibrio nereis]|uniref:hypothetical protein n=1 Tax=Vibrio nereis TaxID=693 RepID=UPI0024955B62|nr:hypothetical protein [Vibrio nereis]